jgi:two-component system, NarL family, sensor histidine kinase BarA
MNNTEPTKIIDWDAILIFTNNNEPLAEKLLAKFIASLPSFRTNINDLFAQQDYPGLAAEIHKLLGSCAYCPVPRLQTYVKFLNLIFKQQKENYNHEEIKEVVELIIGLINIEMQNVIDAFEKGIYKQ